MGQLAELRSTRLPASAACATLSPLPVHRSGSGHWKGSNRPDSLSSMVPNEVHSQW